LVPGVHSMSWLHPARRKRLGRHTAGFGPGRPTVLGADADAGLPKAVAEPSFASSSRRNLDKESEYMTTGVAMTNELDKQFPTEGARNWTKLLTQYRQPQVTRSIVEILITFVPFVILWMLTWAA